MHGPEGLGSFRCHRCYDFVRVAGGANRAECKARSNANGGGGSRKAGSIVFVSLTFFLEVPTELNAKTGLTPTAEVDLQKPVCLSVTL